MLQQLKTHCTISCTDIPDLVSILSVVAARNHGAVFTNIRRLRIKESDRVASTIAMIQALGGQAKADENTLTIYGTGLVIATGGGCVTQLRNYPFLHQNGTIFWLQRDLNKLPTDGRPLSKTGTLSAMYENRKKLYEDFSDRIVSNNGSLEDAVSSILSQL